VKILIFILFFFMLSKAEVITFSADEYCPYNCTPGSENPGYLIEIAQAIFTKYNYEVKYVLESSFEASIQKTRSGEYDAILSVLKVDVPDFIFPTHEQAVVDNVFYIRENFDWKYTGLESLKKVRLGHITGYSYFKEFDEYIESIDKDSDYVQHVSGPSAFLYNLKKLQYEQIDVIIEDRYVIEYYYKQSNKKNPFKIGGRLFERDLFIGFSPNSKNSKKYAEILSKGMQRIKEDGTLDALLLKYGLHE